jgi:glycine/D-amino acid oxidase-like deaminating enzyme
MLPFQDLSYWEKQEYIEQIDVAIIGSGIVGMTTAIAIKRTQPKLKVVVLERGYLPTGASTKNAGFTCFGSPTELRDDLNNMSETDVWDTVAMRYEGLSRLFEVVNPNTINYEACGSWDLLANEKPIDPDMLDYFNQHVKRISGQDSCFSIDTSKIEASGFRGFNEAYLNRLEGSIHTNKLIVQLHQRCVDLGIKFLYNTQVNEVEPNENGVQIETIHGELFANKVAVCTNGFAKQLLPLAVEPARAQVLVTSPISNLKIQGTFHLDCGYYYLRNIGTRVLLGGGRNLDFNAENTYSMKPTEHIQQALISLLKTNILPSQTFEIEYQWAGTMGVGTSKQPLVKKLHKNLIVGVRMGGMGVAIGSLVGEQLSKLTLNE